MTLNLSYKNFTKKNNIDSSNPSYLNRLKGSNEKKKRKFS